MGQFVCPRNMQLRSSNFLAIMSSVLMCHSVFSTNTSQTVYKFSPITDVRKLNSSTTSRGELLTKTAIKCLNMPSCQGFVIFGTRTSLAVEDQQLQCQINLDRVTQRNLYAAQQIWWTSAPAQYPGTVEPVTRSILS